MHLYFGEVGCAGKKKLIYFNSTTKSFIHATFAPPAEILFPHNRPIYPYNLF